MQIQINEFFHADVSQQHWHFLESNRWLSRDDHWKQKITIIEPQFETIANQNPGTIISRWTSPSVKPSVNTEKTWPIYRV